MKELLGALDERLFTQAALGDGFAGLDQPSPQLPPADFAQSSRVCVALSMLCENPLRRTGLSTLFDEFLRHALAQFPRIDWLIFAGRNQPVAQEGQPNVRVIRDYPANDRRHQRLLADHLRVGPHAKRLGAAVLLTVGFVPYRAPLPVVMQVFSLHFLDGGGGWRGIYRRRAVRRGLGRAALVIVNSQWSADRLYQNGHYTGPREQLLISPEGLQHDRFFPPATSTENLSVDHEARAALALPSKYILWSSNFYPYKRAALALRAYAALPRELQNEFPLVLIGGGWEGGLQAARAEAARLNLGDRAKFLGWIEDRWLPACYRGARAHILSTAEETFGRSVLESMSCGCPSVLQDLSVLREVAGSSAMFVDFASTETAARALAKICSDDVHHARLRDAGITRAGHFSFERLARERVHAILRCIGQ